MSNEFLPFTPTDTGTNLLSQADYSTATDRTIGNQPGIASSKLNNKAIRQATYVVSQISQFVADKTGADVLDNALPARLLAQINATLKFINPKVTRKTSGTGTHNVSFHFFIATGSATTGATYTNNGVTYTVASTIASGVELTATGNGIPAVSGTLTKTGGTGDATLTFYAARAPLYLNVKMVGGGGGGGGSSSFTVHNGNTGATGGNTTFGLDLTANGGIGGTGGNVGGNSGGTGGTASISGTAVGIATTGGGGGGGGVTAATNFPVIGGTGAGPGGGNATSFSTTGGAGVANTGGGGAGASCASDASGSVGGGGGGAGGYIDAVLNTLVYSYSYAVGAGGAGGAGGSQTGGDGGTGAIEIVEYYQ